MVRRLRILGLMVVAVAFTAAAQQMMSSSGGRESHTGTSAQAKQQWNEAVAAKKAWTVSEILADRTAAQVDTAMENYAQSVAIPSFQYGTISAVTGNLGGSGRNMNYFERQQPANFFFNDAMLPYIPAVSSTPFYNTRIPMTLASFNTGGSSETTQDWLKVRLSGNINSKAQVGGFLSYLYSRGMYEAQAAKHFNWGFSGSYLGERYQMMAIFNNWNPLAKENGGIQDDRYITDPAEVQGGSTKVNTKQIPVNLQDAHSHLIGHEVWMTHRYRMGFKKFNEEDSTEVFVPVSQVFWTFDWRSDEHRFVDNASADDDYFENTYFTIGKTYDVTRQWTMSNAIGIELLEGFNKYAKAGLAAYAMHEWANYTQTRADTLPDVNTGIRPKATEHSLFIGARLSKQQGSLLRYSADARIGVAGAKAGEIDAHGNLDLRFRMLRDTVNFRAYIDFTNLKPSFFLREFVSNHFMWQNDFGKTRRLRFGGMLAIPHTSTYLTAGLENAQNVVYFNSAGMPVQHGGNVQIFSASLDQRLKVGILHWDNKVTYQKSSNQSVIPLPDLTVYSNLYIKFRIATLYAQLGVDCTYTTRYYAHGYQPATMSFTNQQEIKLGNYPMMDVYLNMKLKRVKFYVLYSHFNDGLFGGKGKFSVVHHPLNPARFMMGLSVDFAK